MSFNKSPAMGRRVLVSFKRFVMLVGGLGLGAAVLLSPGLMARALSADGAIENHTVWEIQAWRIVVGIASLTLIAACALWQFGKATRWVAMVESDFSSWRSPVNPPEPGGRRWEGIAFGAAVVASLAMVTLIFLSFNQIETPWFSRLALESGVVENAQALFLLTAGVLLIGQSWRDFRRAGRPLAIVGVVYGLLMIVGAGEEISWGQHWLGFATPESIAAVNVQGEFNLHNIGSYWVNHAQMALLLGFAGLIPALGYVYAQVHYGLDRLSLPIAPIVLLPVVLFATTLDEHDRIAQLWGDPPWRLSEAREFVFAFCMLIMVLRMRRYRRAASAS